MGSTIYTDPYILPQPPKHTNHTCANPAQGRRTGDGDCRTSSTETRRSQLAHSPLPPPPPPPEGRSHAASSAGRSMLRRRCPLAAAIVVVVGSMIVVVAAAVAQGFSIATPSLLFFSFVIVRARWTGVRVASHRTPCIHAHQHTTPPTSVPTAAAATPCPARRPVSTNTAPPPPPRPPQPLRPPALPLPHHQGIPTPPVPWRK